MAATVALVRQSKLATLHTNIVDITLDNSYPTGGYAITPQQVGLDSIAYVDGSPNSGYIFDFDNVNSKLRVYWGGGAGAALTQVTAGTNLSAVVTRAIVVGY